MYKLHLVLNYDDTRNAIIKKNLESKIFSKIILVVNSKKQTISHPDVVYHITKNKIDFKELANIANMYADNTVITTVLLGNIVFDESILKLRKLYWSKLAVYLKHAWCFAGRIPFVNEWESSDELNGISKRLRVVNLLDDIRVTTDDPQPLVSPSKISAVENPFEGKGILHFGITMPLHISQSNALRSISTNYNELDWRVYSNKNGAAEASRKMLEMIKEKNPEFIFIQAQSPGVFTYELIDKFSKLMPDGGKIINFTGDIRTPTPAWYMDIGKHPSVHTVFTNQRDPEILEKRGCKSFGVYEGFDDTLNNPYNTPSSEFSQKLIFVANLYPGNAQFTLTSLRRQVGDQMYSLLGDDFAVYGNGVWNTKYYKRPLSAQDEGIAYTTVPMAISLNNVPVKACTSVRLQRALASGTLVFANKFEDMEKSFEDKRDLIVWSSINELKELVKYYKDSPDRPIIAHNGMEHTWMNFNWRQIMMNIFDRITNE